MKSKALRRNPFYIYRYGSEDPIDIFGLLDFHKGRREFESLLDLRDALDWLECSGKFDRSSTLAWVISEIREFKRFCDTEAEISALDQALRALRRLQRQYQLTFVRSTLGELLVIIEQEYEELSQPFWFVVASHR
ncbi:MAG TPA: hypothetical protein VG866_01070 [Candidatus Paceibacterota bacterium]|nr:hypothetical protein [Candidatus Paceibacterota bacterium]